MSGSMSGVLPIRARNWPRPIVRDEQQSGRVQFH